MRMLDFGRVLFINLLNCYKLSISDLFKCVSVGFEGLFLNTLKFSFK